MRVVRLRHGRDRRRAAAHRPGRRRDRPAVATATTSPARSPHAELAPLGRRGPRGAHRRAVAGPRARRGDAAAARDPVQPGPRRVRHRGAAAAAAHAAGALLAVDNTTATPLGQRPLALGADLVVASGTKALTGHCDVLLGYVTAADPALAQRLREARTRGGAVPGPFEAWLAHRALGTLDLRLARQAANAAALARALRGPPRRHATCAGRGCPTTRRTRSPPRRCAGGPGCSRSRCPRPTAVSRFLAASRYTASATSFGGLRTTADRRARWGDAVAPGLVRLSAGCEDTADLVADVVTRPRRRLTRRRFGAISHSRNPASLWFPPE